MTDAQRTSDPMASELMRVTFQNLREITEDALQAACLKDLPGPVNWGDLRCVEVSYVVRDEGRPYFNVLIEEASPDASELQQFVLDAIARRGYMNVEVETAW